jgi:thymidylate synthase ThyX
MEQFTEEEQEILKPFFTNLDKPIFALRNLPEVMKGALFSRYSRSDKSLRRVLLEEFIKKSDMGFKDIVGFQVSRGEEQAVAIQKAEEFYDRVLVGFGDDSVAELGGAHLACEDISNVATKVIEDSRIGISPLEKSTRYVIFGKKIDGKYQYYRDADIMQSNLADMYIETNDLLFDTYSKVIEPMSKYIMERFPQEEGVSERAYKASVKAKTCDTLRLLLPLSTLTNVGLFGNGRAFEYMLTKMYSHELGEIRGIANSMYQELNKVIPSFVKRSNDVFGKQAQEYIAQTRESVWKLSNEFLGIEKMEKSEMVGLVEYDADAELKVLAVILYPHSTLPLHQIREKVKKMNQTERKRIIHEYLERRKNRRHRPGRAFENVYYTFDLLGNFGVYKAIQRHRILTQERQGFTVRNGYDTPKEIIEAGFKSDFDHCMERARDAFEKIYEKFPKQAQYVVPHAYKARWYMKMNLRELYHLVELRTMRQGHADYRRIAQEIFKKVKAVHPALVEYMKFVDMNEYSLERLEAEKSFDKRVEEVKKKYDKL